MMTTMLFNFGMIFFVPQLFLIGLWTMGKSWHLPTTLPRGGIRRRSRKPSERSLHYPAQVCECGVNH